MSALHMAERADGTWLVSADKKQNISTLAPDGTMRLWPPGDGKLERPWGIAVASPETGIHAGEVVVADFARNCVLVFGGVGGRHVRRIPPEPLKLRNPQGVAVTSGLGLSGAVEVFVSEKGHHRISVFRLSDGTFLRRWGQLGRAPGEFNDPAGVCLTEHGEVVVSDYENNRIQVFRPDGTFVRQFGTPGSFSSLNHPWGVVTRHQEVFVADYHHWRVQVFRTDGIFLHVIYHHPMFKPTGLCLSRNGFLLVGHGQSVAIFCSP